VPGQMRYAGFAICHRISRQLLGVQPPRHSFSEAVNGKRVSEPFSFSAQVTRPAFAKATARLSKQTLSWSK